MQSSIFPLLTDCGDLKALINVYAQNIIEELS